MARQPRLVIAHQPHHLIQRGNNRQPIFMETADYQAYLNWLREGCKRFGVAIHAYVLMSNHVHLLASPQDADSLAKLMQWLGRVYVPWFNRKYGRTGSLWEGRFRTSVVDSEAYLLICSRYIELNPVRAGLVNQPQDYPWSSYMHHVGLKIDPFITEHALFWALGNTPSERDAAYKALFEQALSQTDLALIGQGVHKGRVTGQKVYQEKLAKTLDRPIIPNRRGRPKGTKTVQELSEIGANLSENHHSVPN